MGIVSYALRGNFAKFYDKLKVVSEETGKNRVGLLLDFLGCVVVHGCGYSDYVNYKLYNRTKDERKEYVSIKDEDVFYEIVSPSKHKTFFTVKPNFLTNFKKYIFRDFYILTTLEELKVFLEKHEYFMQKPLDGLGGHGVEKVYAKDIANVEEYFERLKNERLFLEEYIVQNEEINKICSSSVNTVRIMTFANAGKSEILFAGLRVGNGKSNVDNFHQGGMGVLVDVESGKLVGDAYTKDLVKCELHPVSKVKFDGFQLPNWEYIKSMVLEAALVNPNIHVVGWDVAITNEGATFVEGNRRPGFDLVQVLYDRGRKDIMRHCLEEINKTENTNYKV